MHTHDPHVRTMPTPTPWWHWRDVIFTERLPVQPANELIADAIKCCVISPPLPRFTLPSHNCP